jgi:hypothetical protein
MSKNVQYVGSRLHKTVSLEQAWYITGFVDGEGCFSISFNKRAKMKTGIEIRPSFSIGQNKKSLSILQEIHQYFGCGSIRFSKIDQTYKYEVRSIKDLKSKVLPHFKKYPLKTAKSNDFIVFSNICNQISAMQHLNKDKLSTIILEAYQMNESGKRKYTKDELLKIIEAR